MKGEGRGARGVNQVPFERARFELHPENQARYDVLLGQFSRLSLASSGRPQN
ncbi:MAG: hypothetical protein AVDCRST_MAG88-368, partial [uncultured Thermomicrobiales bacterium]